MEYHSPGIPTLCFPELLTVWLRREGLTVQVALELQCTHLSKLNKLKEETAAGQHAQGQLVRGIQHLYPDYGMSERWAQTNSHCLSEKPAFSQLFKAAN